MKNQFVVIKNAIRQYKRLDYGLCKAQRGTANYRENEIGMIHPEITNHIKKINSGEINKYFISIFMGEIMFYKPSNDETSILIHEKNHDKDRYLITNLRKNEFKTLQSSKFEDILKEAGINVQKDEYKESSLKESYKHLTAFDILKPNLEDIAIELSAREVSDEQLNNWQGYLNKIKDMEMRRRSSPIDDTVYK